MTQANREVVSRANKHIGTMVSRFKDLTIMNPPTFYRSKVEKDPMILLTKIYRILHDMGLTIRDKSELSTYQLKYISQTWFVQWRDNRPLIGGQVTWEVFKKTFIDRFFYMEKRESKVVEFFNHCQGYMSVLEYSLKFAKLSNYDALLFQILEMK